MAALLGLTGALTVGAQPWVWVFAAWQLVGHPAQEWTQLLNQEGMLYDLVLKAGIGVLFGIVLVLSALAALLGRGPLAHRLLSLGIWTSYATQVLIFLTIRGIIAGFVEMELARSEESAPHAATMQVFQQTLAAVWPQLIILALQIAWHVGCLRARAFDAFGRDWTGVQAPGDRLLESIRSGGPDQGYRSSFYSSVGLHIGLVIFFMINLRGCLDRYLVPEGSGNPAVAQVVATKVTKKKEVMILAEDSPIIFATPEITDSQVVEEIQKESEREYETTAAGTPGAMGAGGGTEGGWPDGMPGGKLRWIQLQYGAKGWEDGLNKTTPVGAPDNAVRNFLNELRKLDGIKFDIATNGEPKSVTDVTMGFEKGYAPPFVYMTGTKGFRLSDRDITRLRDFTLDGSMLFADAGSMEWDRSFRSMMRRMFPGKQLVKIGDDDIIFQAPYAFRDGIDPLFAHGGSDAMGIKHKGRWAVFYHPGDINDCWKDGNTRIAKAVRENAFQTGVNLIYYSVTRYLEETRKYRKK